MKYKLFLILISLISSSMISSSLEKITTLSESELNQMARINGDNSSDSKVEQIKKTMICSISETILYQNL